MSPPDTIYALPVEAWYEYDTVQVADTFVVQRVQHLQVEMVSKEKYLRCIDKATDEMWDQCFESIKKE
jgi:hypothetical protein